MALRSLFSFPDPVNETSARLVAAGVLVVAAVTVAFQQPWLIAVLAYGFLARAATGPTLSPLGQFVTRVVTPRLHVTARYSPGPAKRFAQAVGAVFTVSAAVLALGFGQDVAAYVLVGLVGVFALLEAAVGLCVGCKVFAFLMRAGVIPESVCVRCADLWAR
jgi:uncharacterized protein DUF4395